MCRRCGINKGHNVDIGYFFVYLLLFIMFILADLIYIYIHMQIILPLMSHGALILS